MIGSWLKELRKEKRSHPSQRQGERRMHMTLFKKISQAHCKIYGVYSQIKEVGDKRRSGTGRGSNVGKKELLKSQNHRLTECFMF